MDGKFSVFGEVPDADEQTYFEGRIKATVRDTLAAILTAAEVLVYASYSYYCCIMFNCIILVTVVIL